MDVKTVLFVCLASSQAFITRKDVKIASERLSIARAPYVFVTVADLGSLYDVILKRQGVNL